MRLRIVRRPLLPGMFVLVCGVAAACGGGGDSTGSPTAVETATQHVASPAVTATRVASPVATAIPAGPRVASTVMLIDAETRQFRLIAEEFVDSIWKAEFGPNGDKIVVHLGRGDTETYDFDGAPVAPDGPSPCTDVAGGADIGGRVYADVRCGIISPDEAWMYFRIETSQEAYDAVLLNLESGVSTRIQEGLLLDLGSDFYFVPEWSPSSRFLVYPGHRSGSETYLTDVQTMATRILEGVRNRRDQRPVWSPSRDELLIPSGAQTAILDAATGERRELALAWPARWDASGTTLYSPAWGPVAVSETTIMQAARGTELATVAGTPSWIGIWTEMSNVSGIGGGGYTAALEAAGQCEGTTIWTTLRGDPVCVQQGYGAAVSPDGTQVAVMVVVDEEDGPFLTPGNDNPRLMMRYRMVIVDAATGDIEQVDGSDVHAYPAEAGRQFPPALEWNDAGTHVLLRAPASYGI